MDGSRGRPDPLPGKSQVQVTIRPNYFPREFRSVLCEIRWGIRKKGCHDPQPRLNILGPPMFSMKTIQVFPLPGSFMYRLKGPSTLMITIFNTKDLKKP